jgi:hypothetical protein
MLREFAKNLYMAELDENGNIVSVLDSFGTAIEFLGDINVSLMTTSKTLS